MSVETLHNTIRSRFKTQVADVENITVQYDNHEQKPPDDSTWCRFSIQDGDTLQVETGSVKNFRRLGIAFAQIFQPLKQGDESSLELADVIITAFRAVTVSGVTFRTPSIQRVGRRGKWWQVNVLCPFYSDLVV